MKIIKRAIVFVLLGIALICALPAQEQGDELTIKIAIIGPGDELYFWWGHIGLVIDDARIGQSRFYDYGLFSFGNDNFFVNFAFGRLWYSCGVTLAANNIANYVVSNRDVTLYTLDLPPEKREMIYQKAQWDILPENRDYLYHHFRYNCATPVIDIIDMATDGQFKEQFGSEPGRFTLRQHVRRHTWFSPFTDWILNFWMGQDIDVPITVWDEMFLPSEVGRRISEFRYTGSDGISRPLVSAKEIIFQAQGRPAVLDIPRMQWPRELGFSLILTLALACLFVLQAKFPAFGRIAIGVSHSLFGLFFGIAGLFLFFMSTFTGHDYTYHNANILFCNPLLLAAIPLGIRYAMTDSYEKRFRYELVLRLLWLLVVLGIFASMLIKLLPWFWQQNLTDQMLMLPIALALSLEPTGLKRIIQRIRK
ncbi:MAG: DUF4105 domain-containing protein [Treponema sp.]|jgi:hypothetical protein|nr:DUF4105 domain-containing protein [Treponema sp.]